MEPQIFELI